MLTSSNGNIFRVTGQSPMARSFDVFFDLCLNKWSSKQSWGWWFETPLCSLWRHCNTNIETGLLLTFKLLVLYKGTGYRHVEPSAATVLIIIIRFLLISFAYQIFGTHFRWAKGIFQNGRHNPVNFLAFGLVYLIVWYTKELNWIASVCCAMRNNKACC